MQKSSSSQGQLIIVELGAKWPAVASDASFNVRRVLSQSEAESPAAFAVRVGEQLNGLFARGVPLASAVIACSERSDDHAQGARAELARAAASALASARGGSLLLCASDENGGRSRAMFAALHAELAKEWQSAAVEAKLRFADEPAVPGASDLKVETEAAGAAARSASRRGAGSESSAKRAGQRAGRRVA